jgi:ribosomal-protein-alanine N-acetyltransferase
VIDMKQIDTQRLCLRRLSLDDAYAMYNGWAQDRRVTEYVTWKPHASLEETKAILAHWIARYDHGLCQWGIVERHTDKLIGTISYEDNKANLNVGYALAYDSWNKGYATEALRAVIDYVWDTTVVDSISCGHIVGNPASGRVMQKAGMQYVRTQSQALGGMQVDLSMYEIKRPAR